MPRVSAFYGVVIYMYWNERDHPVAHFHAYHSGRRASVSVNGEVLAGSLDPRALQFVREWASLRRDEIMANWERARRNEQLLAIEVETTQARRLASRLRFACLPTESRLDEFDFSAQPGVDEKLIHELASLRFLDDAGNVVFVGPPGTGKTMLAIGLARAAAEAGHRVYFTTADDLTKRCHKAALEGRWATCMRFLCGPRLLVIDEFAYARRNPDPEANTALFEVISRRYLKSSTILTSHTGIAGWGERLGDPMLAAAVLDRVLHTGIVVSIDGPSYRMRAHQKRSDALRRALHPEAKP